MVEESILITGATGFIGKKLVEKLSKSGYTVRAMSRTHRQDAGIVKYVVADALDLESLNDAMKGVTIAYYLLHSMEGDSKNWKKFAIREKQQAQNFLKAASDAGIRRIIYLGGLVNENTDLSIHMKSRKDVGQILASGNIPVTELRASVIVGAEGGSYAMLRYLVERLRVMICPKWVKSQTQPIAVDNVIDYLAGVMTKPETTGKVYEIGGPEKMTYEDMMQIYSSILKKNLFIIQIPFLTPRLSSYWVDLITPVKASLARPLVDSLVHDSIVKNKAIQELIPLKLKSMKEAIIDANIETKKLEPIKKGPEQRTSYKINQKILIISLISMAIIGTTYYWMDERAEILEPLWLFISFGWFAAIIIGLFFVYQKARLGYLIAGVLGWITIAFWMFDNFYVVFDESLIATEPSLWMTLRNFIGVGISCAAIFSAHNTFHKVRFFQHLGRPV